MKRSAWILGCALLASVPIAQAALDGAVKDRGTKYSVRQGYRELEVFTNQAACEEDARLRTANPGPMRQRFELKSGGGALLSAQPSAEDCAAAARARLTADGATRPSGTAAEANVLSCATITNFSTAFQPPTCVVTSNFSARYTTTGSPGPGPDPDPPCECPPPNEPPPALGAPANLRTTSVSTTLVRAQWDALSGAQSYELQFCRGATCANLAPLACVTATGYDHVLPTNATARYKVAASRAADCSTLGAQSDFVTGTTVQPDPDPPSCAALPPDRPQNCPSGYTGTWTQRASAAPYPECVTWSAWNPSTEGCTVVNQPPPPRYMFLDQFEYDVSRSGRSADGLFAGSGWAAVKAINGSMGRGSGYAFTQPDAIRGSKVLVLESHPEAISGFPVAQTDYYLQRGREGSTEEVLPANVWIQFWTYATTDSRFATRDKTIYPCNSYYACSWGPNLGWLFMWGSGGFNVGGDGSSRRYLALEAQNADRDTRVRDGEEAKLFQNVNATPMRGGAWYQVRLHMDTSGAQGTFEAWIKERGQTSFTKVSDWRGGVTPNFSWPIPANQQRGHTMFRMPTTVNQYSNTVYLDDFAISRTMEGLPQ
jgi:hypothetical protein